MFKLRPVTLWVTLFALLTVSKGAIAQNREKIKANLIFKMLDFDARFRMIPGYQDSACRMDLANQAKAEYLDFKQTFQANTALFIDKERGNINEVIKACDKIFLKDEVFNSLKQPDYLSSKKPWKGEVIDKTKWIDIHKACLYVLMKDLVLRSNYNLSYEFSRLAAAADVARNGQQACRHYADSLLTKGGASLDHYFKDAELQNNAESNSYFRELITAFKNKAADLPEQTMAMYERRNVLVLSPESEDADLHLKTLYPGAYVYLDGFFNELKETDKYAIVNPANLPIDFPFFQTKAHKAGKNDTADCTIRIVTPGVTRLEYGAPQRFDGFSRSGFISIITYRCPIKIEILNKAGNVERTFVATGENDEFTDTLHANSLSEFRPGRVLIPFLSEEACYGAMANPDLKNSVASLLFGSKWGDVSPGVSAAINNSYGYWRVYSDYHVIYGIKNPKAGYQNIADVVDSTEYAISHVGKESLRTSCIATLSRVLEKYQEILKRPDISQNMRILCMRNSIPAALLSDQFERTMALLDDYRKVKSDDLLVPTTKFYIFSYRNWLMGHNTATVKLPPYPRD